MSDNEVDVPGKAASVAGEYGNKLNLAALVCSINPAKLVGLMFAVVVGVEHLHFGPFYRLTTGVENSILKNSGSPRSPSFHRVCERLANE